MSDNPLRIRLQVHYGQAYLVDGEADSEPGPLGGPSGMLCPGPPGSGSATLLTGPHTADVDLTVGVYASDPGPALEDYEDAVEASLHLPHGRPVLAEWAHERVHTLPELPAGPGWYRLRYHACDADAGARAEQESDDDEDRDPVDAYLLQIWPAPESAPRVLAAYSQTMQYWISARERGSGAT